MKRIRHAMALCIALVSLSATISTGFTAEEPTQLSLAEMEKAFIDAVLADGDAFKEANYPYYEKPFWRRIIDRRLGCFRSQASGSAALGGTLALELGAYMSASTRGYKYSDRFLVFSGFRPNSADERGFFIVDTEYYAIFPALLHYFPLVEMNDNSVKDQWVSDGMVSVFMQRNSFAHDVLEVYPVVRNWIVSHSSPKLRRDTKIANNININFYAFSCE